MASSRVTKALSSIPRKGDHRVRVHRVQSGSRGIVIPDAYRRIHFIFCRDVVQPSAVLSGHLRFLASKFLCSPIEQSEEELLLWSTEDCVVSFIRSRASCWAQWVPPAVTRPDCLIPASLARSQR